jgi:hypothetical protein
LGLRTLICQLKLGNLSHVNEIRALFTVLCFVRACSGHHTPKFSSIENPHNGDKLTFDKGILRRSLRTLNVTKLKVGKWSFFLPMKAGVNSNSVLLSIGLDLISYIDNRQLVIAYVKFA